MDYLVGKYQQSIKTFVGKRIDDEGVVEELTQDILMAAYEALPSFNKKCSEFSFICSIAKNKITDYYRKKKIKTILFSMNPVFEEIAIEALSPERDVLKNELKEEIRRTLNDLRADYRKIIRLKYVEDLRSSQIAKMMKLSVKAVESRLIRARKQFQNLWNYDKEKNKEFIQIKRSNRN